MITVDRSRCIYCGACVGVCPKLALRLRNDVRVECDHGKCIKCLACTKACPAGAISDQ